MRMVTIATVESEEQLNRLIRAGTTRAYAAQPWRDVTVAEHPSVAEGC